MTGCGYFTIDEIKINEYSKKYYTTIKTINDITINNVDEVKLPINAGDKIFAMGYTRPNEFINSEGKKIKTIKFISTQISFVKNENGGTYISNILLKEKKLLDEAIEKEAEKIENDDEIEVFNVVDEE